VSVDPEKLAAAVFSKEPIWNPRHAGRKNRTIIQQCWSDLSNKMIIDGKFTNHYILFKYIQNINYPSTLLIFITCTHKRSLNILTYASIAAKLSDKSILRKRFN
jgi:hypothetical protein